MRASDETTVRRRWRIWCLLAVIFAWVGVLSAAPSLVCYPVLPGDTASEMAFRLTSDARSRHEPWFQIIDPATARFIQKSQYRHIQPGWQACIAQEPVTYSPQGVQQQGASVGTGGAPSTVAQVASTMVAIGWWWLPFLLSATVLMWVVAHDSTHRRQAVFIALEHFGNTFVREFERPLMQKPGRESPVRSRLRVIPQRNRLEILLAPKEGHRYPNLSDHRRNLEYDVDRVVTLLGDTRFVCGQLAAQGPWIVIPIRLQIPVKKEG